MEMEKRSEYVFKLTLVSVVNSGHQTF